MDDYAFVAQHLQDRPRDIGIFPAGELWSRLHNRYATAIVVRLALAECICSNSYFDQN
jgi:hypothetical protein